MKGQECTKIEFQLKATKVWLVFRNKLSETLKVETVDIAVMIIGETDD